MTQPTTQPNSVPRSYLNVSLWMPVTNLDEARITYAAIKATFNTTPNVRFAASVNTLLEPCCQERKAPNARMAQQNTQH